MGKNRFIVLELLDFLWARKAWWLAPIIIALILIGVLIVFGQSSAVSHFIYAFF